VLSKEEAILSLNDVQLWSFIISQECFFSKKKRESRLKEKALDQYRGAGHGLN
jgi:hypothetical protein